MASLRLALKASMQEVAALESSGSSCEEEYEFSWQASACSSSSSSSVEDCEFFGEQMLLPDRIATTPIDADNGGSSDVFPGLAQPNIPFVLPFTIRLRLNGRLLPKAIQTNKTNLFTKKARISKNNKKGLSSPATKRVAALKLTPAAEPRNILRELPEGSIPGHQNDFLKDLNGEPRGVFLTLDGEDIQILNLLCSAYREAESKLGQVQNYTKNLLHYNLKSPGFPTVPGSDDRELFTEFDPDYVLQIETLFSLKIHNALSDMGYCSDDQSIQMFLSFLKTLRTEVQPPHIDFQWEDINPADFKARHPRSYRNNYKEWVPFIALFPLTKDGMTIQVWHARDNKHNQPACPADETGVVVDIPFGTVLLLRADVVHAGGFLSAVSGNPRGHFYIYKTPRAVQHSYPLSNCYECSVDNQRIPLLAFYKHNAEIEGTQNVRFVRFNLLKQNKKKIVSGEQQTIRENGVQGVLVNSS
jgi:hypothetical protein